VPLRFTLKYILVPQVEVPLRGSIFLGASIVLALALVASAVRQLEWIAVAQISVAAGLLTFVLFVAARDMFGRFRGSAALRSTNEALETKISRSAQDLGDANARLRSIIDSAVDGIIVIDSLRLAWRAPFAHATGAASLAPATAGCARRSVISATVPPPSRGFTVTAPS
jgi:PAS domain-containing protein